jgi:hypothetical protein
MELKIITANQNANNILIFLLTVLWLNKGAVEQKVAHRTYTSRKASSFRVEIEKSMFLLL